jgi:hypothetical protein
MIMIINYPDTFPCPTWAYGTDSSAYPLRTQFDNGWTRSRRAFPQTGMSANLSFVMGTDMFQRWSTFMDANGWGFFSIGLDNGDGTIDQAVRLITPPTWGYDAYDNIAAQISVEVGPEDSCRDG